MKIYTGYGDEGNTQLLGGQQVRKNDVRVSVCGTLDELNAVLGVVASRNPPPSLLKKIATVQSDLFKVGCMIAAIGTDSKMELPTINETDSHRLESEIDAMDAELKPLTNFLLPGGAHAAAAMHLARAVCRRGERLVADMVEQHPDFDATVVFRYLNRLSDWCFVAARCINHDQGMEEPIWQSGQ